ncbi:hypothetical protein WP12_06445 [Sphingomonas sp. SRS2]|nr:hypothetical protein WP12_06445 [Sphingomonas sp. SRS2]
MSPPAPTRLLLRTPPPPPFRSSAPGKARGKASIRLARMKARGRKGEPAAFHEEIRLDRSATDPRQHAAAFPDREGR